MFKCMPDRAHTAHCFLNFRADPVLEGVGSACGAFEQVDGQFQDA